MSFQTSTCLLIVSLICGILTVCLQVLLPFILIWTNTEPNYSCECPAPNISLSCPNGTSVTYDSKNITENSFYSSTTNYLSPVIATPLVLGENLCSINGWVPTYRGEGTTGKIPDEQMLTRQNFVSCSDKECRRFFVSMGYGTTTNFADLIVSEQMNVYSVKLGDPPTPDKLKFEAVGWSASSCHDGFQWTVLSVAGDGFVSILYGGIITDTIHPTNGGPLRTQASSCICNDGTCYTIIADGTTYTASSHRLYRLVNGTSAGWKALDTTGFNFEFPTCYYTSGKVKCTGTNLWNDAKRPFLEFDQSFTYTFKEPCLGFLGDTPRGIDTTNYCDKTTTEGEGGIQGFMIEGSNSWIGRIINPGSKKGFEIYKFLGTLFSVQTVGNRNYQLLSNSTIGRSGLYQPAYESRDCQELCFWIEIAATTKAGLSSNDLITFCGTGGSMPDVNWG
ncbi:neuraminidase-like protein [Influenza A virus (A/flat-faced bat/Peru/033/2010(H18N11))]|uniref:Neuraminidase n=1 Tax=Influenza A virus (A/flat-faced bat/Peru/033/2010(H18N11)) TaxID=1395524 RepID=U5N4D7_9INFA|nr:neuraminidase-like protein [Influenza A virus (A/flat-faced bat/Peru/033/2010(H18N11))]